MTQADRLTEKQKQIGMVFENLSTVFFTFTFILLLHFRCRKTTISTEQDYIVSNTKSSHSASPLNDEHIAKLLYFAWGRLKIKLQIYNSMQ